MLFYFSNISHSYSLFCTRISYATDLVTVLHTGLCCIKAFQDQMHKINLPGREHIVVAKFNLSLDMHIVHVYKCKNSCQGEYWYSTIDILSLVVGY